MKIFKFLSITALSALALGFASCSNNDEPEWNDDGSKVTLPANRMFILNEGIWNQNNSGISFYSPNDEANSIDDIFYTQNGVRLGDTAQDIIKYHGSMYVAVNGSNYLVKLNAACVEEKRVSFVSDPDLQAGVRYITAEGGYIYATFHGGVVAKIDASTLAVVAKLKTPAGNLEGIVETGNKLYVANAYTQLYDETTQNTSFVYNTDVYVIDIKTFTITSTITVDPNPNILVEEDGKVFVISYGNYIDKGYSLQMIDTRKNNAVTNIAVASNMVAGNDKLYILYSETDWSTYQTNNTWSSYDLKSGRLDNNSFLKNAPAALETGNIYMLEVDDTTGDIYIGVTFYSMSNGEIYRFKRDGSFVTNFDSGGQSPSGAVFFN